MDEFEDVTYEDHNLTVSSTSSCEDIQPEVRDQFVKLADALKETNQNLLTFEFMLSQYRKLARIEPFTVCQQSEQQQEQQLDQPGKQVVHQESESSVEVLEQLKCLTLAVVNLQQHQSTSHESVTNDDVTHRLIEEVHTIRGQLQQIGEANEAVAFLRDKTENLERSIEEKNRLIEGLTAGHKRLTSQLAEERDKCLELDRKLESEKRAAAQVGKDITKYVERMSELESKVRSTEPKMLELAEKSEVCRRLTKENEEFQQKLLERAKASDEKSKLIESEDKIKQLESKIRSEAQEKESLKTTIEILKDQLYESRQLNESRHLNDSKMNETSFCRTCIDGSGSDTLEEAAKRVQQLAVDIQRRTEHDIERLSTQNETLLAENRSLEESLRREQNLRHSLETKVTVCQQEIRSYEAQVKEWKEELEALQHELERCQQQQPAQQQQLQQQQQQQDGRFERREKRKMEKELSQLRLNYADTLAAKESLTSSQTILVEELNEAREKLSKAEESLSRLKVKSKALLQQHRSKKQSHAELCIKVDGIRLCLLELQHLCRTKDENYRDILDHLGSQIQISARLVAAYLDMAYNYDALNLNGNVKLYNWFCAIQALSTWTHKQLMVFGAKCWTTSVVDENKGASHRVDCDTLSEISHTFEQDSDKEKSLRSLVEAQDRISRTQKDSFDTLLSRTKISIL